jgi:4,5-dihydroxyphthalate decarboxylase
MSKRLHLTLACGDYETIRALKEGTVKPDGIELTVLTDKTSDIRHWRMIRNHEFDVAELQELLGRKMSLDQLFINTAGHS